MIETERLILRELSLADAERMFIMDSDPEVTKTLGSSFPPVKSIHEVHAAIDSIRRQYQQRDGIGRLAVILRESGEFIGWCGLKHEANVNGRESFIDLGYRFLRSYWGHGYATEAAVACVEYGFRKGYAKICAYALADAASSIKVLRKAGLRLVETFVDEDGEELWFEIDATTFRA